MPAYIIARVAVTDPARYAEYTKRTPAAVAAFGGRFVGRAPQVETLEGPEETRRVVIIEFPDAERARAFFHSDRYTAAKAFRAGAADGQFILVDGYPDAAWAEALAASQALGEG